MRRVFFFSIAVLLVVSACKKSAAPTSDPVNLLTGKWTLLPATYDVYTNGVISSTSNQQYTAGDYGDFKANGEFETLTNGITTTYQYQKVGDTLIFDNTNKAVITTLTATQLTYSFKITINSTIYRVNTFRYKK